MLTFSIVGFGVVLVKFALSGVTAVIATHSINFGTVDAATVAAILTPTLGSYVARRYSDNRYPSSVGPTPLPEVPEPTQPGAQNA